MKAQTERTAVKTVSDGRCGSPERSFETLANHEFEATLNLIDSIEDDSESWKVFCRYHRDEAGLICGERIRLSPAESPDHGVIELDTIKDLVRLPDGRVRQATPDQIWSLSERLMDLA